MTRTEYKQTQWELYHRINENNIIERRCTQCKQWLEENLDNFYLMNKKKPERGFTARCRSCTKDKANKYYEGHTEEGIKRCHDYYHKNKEEDNEQFHKRAKDRDKNREYEAEYHKQWAQKPENKPKINLK